MNYKRRPAEMTEAKWSSHNSPTSMTVFSHEIKKKQSVSAPKWLAVCMCMCSLHSICMCIQLYIAKAINDVALGKK